MSVFKRGSVYWYDFQFQRQRIRESTGLRNLTAALRAKAIRKAGLAEGRAGFRRRQTAPVFREFVVKEFLPWSEQQLKDRPRSYVRYVVSSKPLLAHFGKMRLDAITPGDVEKFKMARARSVTTATTNRDLAALRVMLNYAIRHDYLQQNAVTQVKFFPERPGIQRVVSHEEQKTYITVANPLLRELATLLVETGMRPEEVFTIQRKNVHLNAGYLFVPRGKTRYARRNVPLTGAATEVLKGRLVSVKGAYLFPHRRDTSLPLTTIQKAHNLALRDAAIDPPFRLYDFRHTFGSRAAMAGVDLATFKGVDGALPHLHHHAVCASHSGAQAHGHSKIGGVQRRAELLLLRGTHNFPHSDKTCPSRTHVSC